MQFPIAAGVARASCVCVGGAQMTCPETVSDLRDIIQHSAFINYQAVTSIDGPLH